MSNQVLILEPKQINRIVKRIAVQIYENNYTEEKLVLVGIQNQGYKLASLIQKEIESINKIKTELISLTLDKLLPTQSAIQLDCEMSLFLNQCIVLVDDVSNTGRTLAYSLKPFLNIRVKKIETAVLVNRSHNHFPISINYSGYELTNTMNDHIEVNLEEENTSVYLL